MLFDFVLHWSSRPIGVNVARSFLDAILATIIFVLIEKLTPWMGPEDQSN
jgi:hypothetical protein